ncbi:protein kinase [Streptomyces sp. NPDC051207]|uniref:serine/threonine-protein kinase n=1 Tax=Streptomyces sp. NPDC051207 TaxID=3154641 RepID=UPI00343196A9
MEKLGPGDPQRIGGYRLLARLGAGGMGYVYLARSDRGRTVAVKLVREELARQEEFRARFRQEVRAARQVGGFWTAPVLDADTEAAVPWVATGYVAGPSLHQIVGHDHGALPERSVRILAAGLAHALKDIHAAGIVHRDLKPSNVLVTIDGPRVIDFGIARALETVTDGGLTRTGAVVGSPGFMAPEQVRGERLTPACDVFCLGSVLAYAATGRLPFGTANSGVHALMFRIAQEEPDLEQVPEGIAGLVRDCLRKDPGARPALDDILERTGAQDTVTDGRSRDPWLPGTLVAQLGRHAVRLLDTEDPTAPAPSPGAAPGGGGPGDGAGSDGSAGPALPEQPAGRQEAAAPDGAGWRAPDSPGAGGVAGALGGSAGAGGAVSASSGRTPGAGAVPGSSGGPVGAGGVPGSSGGPVGAGGVPGSPGGPVGVAGAVSGGPVGAAGATFASGRTPGAGGASGAPGSAPGADGTPGPPVPGAPGAGGRLNHLPTLVAGPAGQTPPPTPGAHTPGAPAPTAAPPQYGDPAPGVQPGMPAPGTLQGQPAPAAQPVQPARGAQPGHLAPGARPGHPAYGYPQHPTPAWPGHTAGAAPPPYGTPAHSYDPHAPNPAYSPPQNPPHGGSRSTVLLVVIALVVALAAGGSVYALMNSGDDRTDGGGPAPAPTVTGERESADTSTSGPATGTPSPSPSPSDGVIPQAYLGTWVTTIENEAGRHTRRLTVQQGDVGDTVLSLVAEGPTQGGTDYRCVFDAKLSEKPGKDGPLAIGPSSLRGWQPRAPCSPGEATTVTLLPDGTLERVNPSNGERLVYRRR